MILLVCATAIEARPFIDYHQLKKLHKSEFYGVYKGEGMALLISGMGSLKSAFALSDFICKERETGGLFASIINYGIAGCLSDEFSIGAVVEMDKVIKYDPVEFLRPRPGKLFSSSFPDIVLAEPKGNAHVLATSDHPIFAKEDSQRVAKFANFVDMEGYGYAFVSARLGIPIRMVKGISDFAFKQSEQSFRQNVDSCLNKLLSFHISSANR